jgi:hypothetical protein
MTDQLARRKTFYAILLVTYEQQWTVEAETAEKARELLLSGAGDRCGVGEIVHIEVAQVQKTGE